VSPGSERGVHYWSEGKSCGSWRTCQRLACLALELVCTPVGGSMCGRIFYLVEIERWKSDHPPPPHPAPPSSPSSHIIHMSSDTEQLHGEHRWVDKNLHPELSSNGQGVTVPPGGPIGGSGDDVSDGHGSPNKKKDKNLQRFFLHDDRKGNTSSGGSSANSATVTATTATGTTSVGKLQIIKPDIFEPITVAVATGVEWKHDKFHEMTHSPPHQQASQKSSSPAHHKDSTPTKSSSKPTGEQRSNPPPNSSAAQVNKASGDPQVQTKSDMSLEPAAVASAGASKASKKKKKNSNPSVVDQTTPPQETKSSSQALPSSESTHEESNEKKTDKGKNKSQKQKNKQDGATTTPTIAVDKKENSSIANEKALVPQLKSPSKLEIIPPTPVMGSSPAAVPVPSESATGTVEDAAGSSGKSNHRKNRKARQRAAAAAAVAVSDDQNPPPVAPQVEPEGKIPPQLTKAQSRVVTLVPNEINLNAPPPPPPSPSVGASCSVFDCDDFLISELTQNITATLNFGDVPKKRKRSKKKKNADKGDEDGGQGQAGGSDDDDVGESMISRESEEQQQRQQESPPPEESVEDVVEDVESGQQSSKSSKKKKKKKKKNEEQQQSGDQNSHPQDPQVQTDLEKGQGQKKQQEKGQKNQPPSAAAAVATVIVEVKSEKGNKQQHPSQKTQQVSEPSLGSQFPNGTKNQKGQQVKSQQSSSSSTEQDKLLHNLQGSVMNVLSDSIDNPLPPSVEKEGKKKRRSRRKKKNQSESNEATDDVPEADEEEDGQDFDEDVRQNGMMTESSAVASEPHSYEVVPGVGGASSSTALSYSMFEVNRKSVPSFDEDVPPGFEPSIEDKISTFLPSSLSLPSSSSSRPLHSTDETLDLANKSLDDLVAESLSSLSRLNLDNTIDELDIPLDFEREFRFSFSDPYF
jgi:hypothetical protein